VGPPDWAGLARGLSGTLLRPGQGGYDGARRLFDPRYDAVRPAAVALVAAPADVAECVAFAAKYRLPITARSGGHSYAGWSTGTGLVVNLAQLSTVATAGSVATVGAGAKLVDVYAGLADRGVGVPGGSCPTVGISGLTMGGGIGVVARAFGLTCDNLLGADVVTADGRLRTVDAAREPDLFWALRGGGGGNFGIVTSFRLRARAVGSVAHRFLSWPRSAAATVIPAWLAWVAAAPDELWSNLHLDASGGSLSLRATVTYLGDGAGADRQVDRLAAAAGEPSSRSGSTLGWLDTMKLMAGCSAESVQSCGSYDRQGWVGSSDVIATPLSATGARALVAGVERYAGSVGPLSVIMDGLRGAVGRVKPADTAFWHRAALCTVQYYASLPAGAPPAGRLAGMRTLRAAMRPHTTGGAYVNYLDPGLPDWQRAYYGGNYPRLQRIKATYDPTRLFTFPQAI
jgi:FAD/FMN-containing dehydrogenase